MVKYFLNFHLAHNAATSVISDEEYKASEMVFTEKIKRLFRFVYLILDFIVTGQHYYTVLLSYYTALLSPLSPFQ